MFIGECNVLAESPLWSGNPGLGEHHDQVLALTVVWDLQTGLSETFYKFLICSTGQAGLLIKAYVAIARLNTVIMRTKQNQRRLHSPGVTLMLYFFMTLRRIL